MSGYPVVLRGEALAALVVGGGAVALRKATALLAAGATVRIIAPEIAAELRALGAGAPRLSLVEREYLPGDVGDALLVIAATSDRAVNARIAADGRALHRLVNVADAPDEGNCVTAATHRAGDLVVAVSAGGVPTAAERIRDALARRFDARYAQAVGALAGVRGRLLAEGSAERWRAAREELVGPDFCESVESGDFPTRAARWG
jgi:siroheme synthase-like protein